MGKPAPAYPRGRIDVCGIGVGTASRKRGDKYTVPAIAEISTLSPQLHILKTIRETLDVKP